jgi:thiol-disulfide isomerase/thioredoxin
MSKQPKEPSKRFVILIALLTITILLAVFAPVAPPEWAKPGVPAPNLNAFPVEGTMPDTTNRVVLVDFWASWCRPCAVTMPLFDELSKRYASRGLLVIGVSVDQDRTEMAEFLKRHPVSFPIVRDAYGHLSQAYKISPLPRTFIIGADGKFVGAHEGFEPALGGKDYVEDIEKGLKAAGK